MPEDISEKQKLFAELYCMYRHGTKAAREAGFANPGQYASTLLRHPKYAPLQALIRERLDQQAAGLASMRHAMLDRAMQIAFFDPRTVLDSKGKLLPMDQIDPEDSSCISSVSSKEFEGGSSTAAKFINPLPALKMLFQAAGIDQPKPPSSEDELNERELDEEFQAKMDRIRREYELRKLKNDR